MNLGINDHLYSRPFQKETYFFLECLMLKSAIGQIPSQLHRKKASQKETSTYILNLFFISLLYNSNQSTQSRHSSESWAATQRLRGTSPARRQSSSASPCSSSHSPGQWTSRGLGAAWKDSKLQCWYNWLTTVQWFTLCGLVSISIRTRKSWECQEIAHAVMTVHGGLSNYTGEVCLLIRDALIPDASLGKNKELQQTLIRWRLDD